jgi:AcrR family transcriptional regulator
MNAPDRRPIPAPRHAGTRAGERRARTLAHAQTRSGEDGRVARGLDTRARLREAALRLFAEKGYAQTSTREICTEASVNAAAIHYYFTDKAGLYRDVYLAPILQLLESAVGFARADEPFEAVMHNSYEAFLAPLKFEDEKTMQILRLHFREHADPSGLVGDEVAALAQTHLDSIAAMLCRETGAARPDDDLRRLAASLVALAADFLTKAHRMRGLAPRLYDGAEAIDRMIDRLTGYAVAMLDYERERRRSGGKG